LDWLAFADAWSAPYANVEEDVVFFESTAILNYLEATRPTPLLVPADGLLPPQW
jgi:glutathione S-transferase